MASWTMTRGLILGAERMVTLSLWRKAGWHGGGGGSSRGLGNEPALGLAGAGEKQLVEDGVLSSWNQTLGGVRD